MARSDSISRVRSGGANNPGEMSGAWTECHTEGLEEVRHNRVEGKVLIRDITLHNPDLEDILVQGHFLTSLTCPSLTGGLTLSGSE